MTDFIRQLACAYLLAVAAPSLATAADLPKLPSDAPEVRFDVPASVAATPPELADAGDLITVRLPVSMVVAKGEVDRVDELVIEVDGAPAGLEVRSYSPSTELTTEYAGEIEVRTSTDSDRHLDASLGGILPNPGGSVAQLTPSISAGGASGETESTTARRLPPKEATVVAGAINRRQGVLFKFRPSSQTTLEGEHQLAITFAAPEGWRGGELRVRCRATGQRRLLFVKQRATWGSASAAVAVLPAGEEANRRTVAKPAVPEKPAASLWKARRETTAG